MNFKFFFVAFMSFFYSAIHGMDVVLPQSVTVHLIWVNKTIQPHILPKEIVRNYNKQEAKKVEDSPAWIEEYLKELKEQAPDPTQIINPIGRIADWAMHYPVIIWYDSHFVDNLDQALSHVKEEINRVNPLNPVIFVDVRTLKTVQECRDLFEGSVDFYFRVDLLRVLAGIEYLYGYMPINLKLTTTHEPLRNWPQTNYFVYTDWSVDPMNPQVLLDENTVSNLNNYGMVMAPKSASGFENNFYIAASNNPTLYYSVYFALIKLNVERARKALLVKPADRPNLDHVLYYSYRGWFALYQHLKNMGTMTYDRKDIIPISLGAELFEFLNNHLLFCFGETAMMPSGGECRFIPKKGFKYDDELFGSQDSMYVPIKKQPRSHFKASQFG